MYWDIIGRTYKNPNTVDDFNDVKVVVPLGSSVATENESKKAN